MCYNVTYMEDTGFKLGQYVISIDEIRAKAKGTEIEIPDWNPDSVITVRVRAVDMTPAVMQLRDMPNPLASAANKVFNGEGPAKDFMPELESFERMLPILDSVAKEALVEPTYNAIQEIYPLTLAQKFAIFKFAMGNMEQLESFR